MIGVPLAELVDEILPHVGEHAVPPCVSVHATPLLAGSFFTVAANCWVTFTGSSAPRGAVESVIAGTSAIARADAEGSATEVAVMFTVKSVGGGAEGAVYVVFPLLSVDVGETLPHGPGEQATLQVTPLFAESLATVAVSCAVPPACTMAELLSPMPFCPKPTPTAIPEEGGGGGGGGGVVVAADPPPHPELPAAMRATRKIAMSDMRFLSVMIDLSFHDVSLYALRGRIDGSSVFQRSRPALAIREQPLCLNSDDGREGCAVGQYGGCEDCAQLPHIVIKYEIQRC